MQVPTATSLQWPVGSSKVATEDGEGMIPGGRHHRGDDWRVSWGNAWLADRSAAGEMHRVEWQNEYGGWRGRGSVGRWPWRGVAFDVGPASVGEAFLFTTI
ncbi:hypothetical protein CNBD0750 [Cryptococcus deneoformans B-3501A]|uniref:hypothetical protein n=1 Tax=Cryptococcus deneoformans (strain B-3501A) TaxID=283643 RepID=UPI000042F40F|nr:hypothetical protein CNBD0750 [Cryptococcus neoformans var. neoformans B-3501A]EAL21379.1 hypothetical protein CNBD0750 [Cryptococcus neoformans var. neoformans B-3501A]